MAPILTQLYNRLLRLNARQYKILQSEANGIAPQDALKSLSHRMNLSLFVDQHIVTWIKLINVGD